MSDIPILCPNCGSHETVDQNQETFKCHHCFRTFPTKESKTVLDSTLRRRLDDAIVNRNSCDFDDAKSILDDLVSEHPDIAEIYYQRLLTDYGVSFVSEDGTTINQKPVISSVQPDSIFSKDEYHKLESLLAKLPNQLENYKSRLEEIEKIRKDAQKAIEKIPPFDVFICYKRTAEDGDSLTQDSYTAGKIYQKLSTISPNNPLNVFFAEETLKHYTAGAYEPVIYRALFTAKLFILVCASPKHKEYLLAPWVKNEWTRFKKRKENHPDENLGLLCVFDKGFNAGLLPQALQKLQALEYDADFNDHLEEALIEYLPRAKKSQFSNANVKASKVGPLSIKAEEVGRREFKGYKEKALDNSEKTDFTMAVADMKINTNSKYKAAYRKLTHLTQTNKTNFEVNVAKLKCNFKIPYEDSLVKANLWIVDNIDQMNNDYLDVIEGGGEGCDGVRKAMIQMLKKAFADNPVRFANELKKEESTFLTIAKTITDKKDLLNYAKDFEEPYFDLLSKRDQHKKLKDEDILNIANKLFRRIYSNYGEAGAKSIFNLYRKSFMRLASSGSNKNLVDKFINLALQINKLDVDCLWYRFCFDLNCLGADEYTLANALNSGNFTKFEVEEGKEIDAKYSKANVYYFMIRAIQSGYKMDFTSKSANENYFNIILRAACILTNKKNTIGLAKQIFDALGSLTGSASVNDENTVQLLLTIGDRLLVEMQYKDARRYYEEVLNIDETNIAARWGLVKCDVKKPTNYSLLFYRKSLNDLPSYRGLISAHQEYHANEVNHYLSFYDTVERIKYGRGKENSNLRKAFKLQNEKLMKQDLPQDTHVKNIIASIANGTLAQTAVKPKNPTTSSSYSDAGEKAAVITSIALIVLSVAAVIMLKPEASFVVVFLTSIVAAIMARFGYGHLATGKQKNMYKALLIVFGLLSMVLFGVVNYLVFAETVFPLIEAATEGETSVYTAALNVIFFPILFALINLIVTLVRKCKQSSTDCDNSNVFTYYLLAIMAISAAAFGGWSAAFTLCDTSTIFGIPVDITEGIWSTVIFIMPVAVPAVTAIALRLIRGSD